MKRYPHVLNGYLSDEQAQLLAGEASRRGCSKIHIIREAVNKYFAGKVDQEASVIATLARVERTLGNMKDREQAFSEIFGVFVKLYLAHTPRIDPEYHASAQAEAESRYARFLDGVAAELVKSTSQISRIIFEHLIGSGALEGASDDE